MLDAKEAASLAEESRKNLGYISEEIRRRSLLGFNWVKITEEELVVAAWEDDDYWKVIEARLTELGYKVSVNRENHGWIADTLVMIEWEKAV